MFWFKKKPKYNVLPEIGHSYVMNNGEPMPTYYRPNSGLFCSTPLSENDRPYFLNIRRPIVIDVKDVAPIIIPNDLPIRTITCHSLWNHKLKCTTAEVLCALSWPATS